MWKSEVGVGTERAIRTDIFVTEFVREADSLRLMLDGLAIDDGNLEVLCNGAMD